MSKQRRPITEVELIQSGNKVPRPDHEYPSRPLEQIDGPEYEVRISLADRLRALTDKLLTPITEGIQMKGFIARVLYWRTTLMGLVLLVASGVTGAEVLELPSPWNYVASAGTLLGGILLVWQAPQEWLEFARRLLSEWEQERGQL